MEGEKKVYCITSVNAVSFYVLCPLILLTGLLIRFHLICLLYLLYIQAFSIPVDIEAIKGFSINFRNTTPLCFCEMCRREGVVKNQLFP
jgi:hypothetical protein